MTTLLIAPQTADHLGELVVAEPDQRSHPNCWGDARASSVRISRTLRVWTRPHQSSFHRWRARRTKPEALGGPLLPRRDRLDRWMRKSLQPILTHVVGRVT